jgi:hypothetical protein
MNTIRNNLITIYQRLELPPFLNYGFVNDFVIESLAKPQWRKLQNERPYTLTPFTYYKKSYHEYDYWKELQTIQYNTSFFMKPYNILAYGNNYKDQKLDTLMVRGWLHENKKNELNVLIMMEKMNKINLYDSKNKYYYILNNPYWYPTLDFFEVRKKLKEDKLIQEVNFEKKDYEIK